MSNDAVGRLGGGEIGRVRAVHAERRRSRRSRGARFTLGARLHLVGVDSFAALTLTFLVSHHDEAFALA
jgi:hypothetical protein